MRLIPSSLIGRTSFILVVVLILSQLFSNYLVRHFYVEPQAKQRMALIGKELKLIKQTLRELPLLERQTYLEEVAKQQSFLLLPMGRREPIRIKVQQKEGPLLKEFSTYAPKNPGEKQQMIMQQQGERALWVKLQVSGGSYWIGIPASQLRVKQPWQWVVWVGVGIIVAILWALWLFHKINKPLARLTKASEQMSRGEIPEKLDESGGSEIGQLSHAFNKMVSDIQSLTENRKFLLAGVSHDLRTPLARMRLAIEMMPKENDAIKEDLILDIEDMNTIIEQFLTYIRHGSDEQSELSDINALIQSISKRFHHEKHKIDLKQNDIKSLQIKPMAMQRALINLINNAFTHAQSDVVIETIEQDDKVIIQVEDFGEGMSDEEIELAWQPFSRGGMGLAITKRIIESMGGSIQLASKESGGLVVQIII